jgi:transposase
MKTQEKESASKSRETLEKPERRHFTAKYKRDILVEADACHLTGEVGALLRREGLYASHLATWRKQRDAGEIDALTPKKRGRKPKSRDDRDQKIHSLEAENIKLRARAEKAELLVSLQKKMSEILGIVLPDPNKTS